MRVLKVLLGVAAVGAIALAFRDFRNERWLEPALPGGLDDDEGDLLEAEAGLEEPILGYDGMDRDTLVDWLDDADLDEETLLRIRRYEEAGEAREPVLDKVDDLLAAFG